MKIYKELKENRDSALALGFFDGIHEAHKKIINKTVQLARENKIQSCLITFEKSPASIITGKDASYILSLEDKTEIIKQLGIDNLYILDFAKFKDMKADIYIRDVLLKYFYPKYIITGFNHTFGLNREGNSKLLSLDNSVYKYIEVEPVTISNILISSTNIKNAIKEGELALASKMLGRNFSIKGKVVKGAQIARTLGYKTANIIWDKEIVKPVYGVYSGLATYEGVSYQALINFGARPSVDKNLKETLEVHLIGFEGNLYNKTIEVEFFSKIRNEKKFSSLEELKEQINLDYEKIKSSPLNFSIA